MSAPICFLDTETTSLGPDREPWEIAMIRREGNLQREISFFIDGVDLSKADPMSLKFSRFYERHPHWTDQSTIAIAAGYPSYPAQTISVYVADRYDAARLVHDFTRGAHIVGAVPNFDTEMLARVMRESRLVPAWHYHLIDVENLAVGWLRHFEEGNMAELRKIDPKIEFAPSKTELPWKSDDLSRACGIEPPSDEERHTALGDARWCMRLYDKIMGVES